MENATINGKPSCEYVYICTYLGLVEICLKRGREELQVLLTQGGEHLHAVRVLED
jgi:hypothetical protein